MKKPPTDLQILEEIHKRYYPIFTSFSRDNRTRSAKVYVPIDITGIAKHFGADPDIIFGRLYYHLDPKYGFVQPDGTKVSFFSIQIGSDRHCVQFPLLDAVIAKLKEERNKHRRNCDFISFASSFDLCQNSALIRSRKRIQQAAYGRGQSGLRTAIV